MLTNSLKVTPLSVSETVAHSLIAWQGVGSGGQWETYSYQKDKSLCISVTVLNLVNLDRNKSSYSKSLFSS